MAYDDKTVWNRKYAEAPEKWLEPDPFLIRSYQQFLRDVPPGSALDLAGGAGRHAIWLATRGWRVTIIDVSDVGLELARKNASKVLGPKVARERVAAHLADFNDTSDLDGELYELILVFRYLNRALFPALIRALKPGGTLIYTTYTTAQKNFEKGPRDERFLLQPGELRHAFAALELLHYEEKSQGQGSAELVARKSSHVASTTFCG